MCSCAKQIRSLWVNKKICLGQENIETASQLEQDEVTRQKVPTSSGSLVVKLYETHKEKGFFTARGLEKTSFTHWEEKCSFKNAKYTLRKGGQVKDLSWF